MNENKDVLNTNENNLPDVIPIDPEHPHSLDHYLDQMDLVHNDTAILRDKLIRQMGTVVSKIEFDPNSDRLDDVTKKVMVIDTLTKLIDSREKSISNRVNLRMKTKVLDGNEALGKIAADILTKIDLSIDRCNKNQPIPSDNLHDLECTMAALKIDIPESELRDDPYDMT